MMYLHSTLYLHLIQFGRFKMSYVLNGTSLELGRTTIDSGEMVAFVHETIRIIKSVTTM